MISVSTVSWRNYAVEAFCAFSLSFLFLIFLLRAGQLTPLLYGVAFVGIVMICKKHILSFGNPAITVAQIALRSIHWYTGLALVALQLCFGALAGVVVNLAFDMSRMQGLAKFAQSTWNAGVAEAIGGFILVAGVMALVQAQKTDSKDSLSFGLLIIAVLAIITPAIVGSIGVANPASAFALGLFGNVAYVLAPIIGGILGGVFYSVVVDEQSFRSLVK
jgi:glycerol uptake facilitator-like aquaporin